MEKYFRKLIGKVYRNSESETKLILAWKINHSITEKQKILSEIGKFAEMRTYFFIQKPFRDE